MKTNILRFLSIFVLFSILVLFITQCTKTEDTIQNDIYDKVESIAENDKMMNPGPDPAFIDYQPENNSMLRAIGPLAVVEPTWERRMYIDKTDTIYNNVAARNRLAGYLKNMDLLVLYV